MPWNHLAALFDHVPQRVAGGLMVAGGVIAAAAPEPTVSTAGIIMSVATGLSLVAKVYLESKANQDHRDDCHEQLKEMRVRAGDLQARVSDLEAKRDQFFDRFLATTRPAQPEPPKDTPA